MEFEEACELVRNREDVKVSESDKRLMYTFYKVATVGREPNVPRPMNPMKAPYWDAWKTHGFKITPEDAKQRYVNMVLAQQAKIG